MTTAEKETEIDSLDSAVQTVGQIALRLESIRQTQDADLGSFVRQILSKQGVTEARNLAGQLERSARVGFCAIKNLAEVVPPLPTQDSSNQPPTELETETELPSGYRIVIDGREFDSEKLGIKRPRELEVLRLLGQLNLGESYTSKEMIDRGFHPNGKSPGSKRETFLFNHRIVLEDLTRGFGEEVVKKNGNTSGTRWVVMKQISLFPIIVPSNAQKGTAPTEVDSVEASELEAETGLSKEAVSGEAESGADEKDLPGKIDSQTIKKNPASRVTASNKMVFLPGIEAKPHDRISDNLLPKLDPEFWSSLQPRDPAEVLEDIEIKSSVSSILDNGAMIQHRANVVIALRYGAYPDSLAKKGLSFPRCGEYVQLQEVMKNVISYQGLDVKSTSLVTGLSPRAVMATEIAFIKFCGRQKEHEALNRLLPALEKQLINQMRADSVKVQKSLVET